MKTITVKVKNKKAYTALKDLEEAKLIELLDDPIGFYEAKKAVRNAERTKSIPLIDAKALSASWKKLK